MDFDFSFVVRFLEIDSVRVLVIVWHQVIIESSGLILESMIAFPGDYGLMFAFVAR